jgi:hypothetical protein
MAMIGISGYVDDWLLIKGIGGLVDSAPACDDKLSGFESRHPANTLYSLQKNMQEKITSRLLAWKPANVTHICLYIICQEVSISSCYRHRHRHRHKFSIF